jgi:hypothetical protein
MIEDAGFPSTPPWNFLRLLLAAEIASQTDTTDLTCDTFDY